MAEANPEGERAGVEQEARSPPLSEIAGTLLEAARRFVQDVGELLGLETRRAVQALAWMAALAVTAGLLGAAAWFLLLAAAYTALLDLGVASATALLLLAGFNLLGAAASVAIIRRLSGALSFPAARRVLLGHSQYGATKPQNTGT